MSDDRLAFRIMLATLLTLCAFAALVGLPDGASGSPRDPNAPRAEHRWEPGYRIHSQDPIATCAPTPAPGPTLVPGLYPIVSVAGVGIRQVRLPNGCPTTAMELTICLRNDGPASSGSFPPTHPGLRRRQDRCAGREHRDLRPAVHRHRERRDPTRAMRAAARSSLRPCVLRTTLGRPRAPPGTGADLHPASGPEPDTDTDRGANERRGESNPVTRDDTPSAARRSYGDAGWHGDAARAAESRAGRAWIGLVTAGTRPPSRGSGAVPKTGAPARAYSPRPFASAGSHSRKAPCRSIPRRPSPPPPIPPSAFSQ